MAFEYKKNIDELKCIWMSTDYVEEKLCNNDFDCNNCDFDKEMKSNNRISEVKSYFPGGEYSVLEDIISRLNSLKVISYPSNYKFNKSFVYKKFLGDTYFMGFNPILNIVMDNFSSCRICGSGNEYKKDSEIFCIEGDWGRIAITAPFDFKFESEILPMHTGADNKWIGFIKSTEDNISSVSISRENYLKSIDMISGQLKKYIRKYVTVGITMYDGGERLKFIYQVIGKENFLKLITSVLS